MDELEKEGRARIEGNQVNGETKQVKEDGKLTYQEYYHSLSLKREPVNLKTEDLSPE